MPQMEPSTRNRVTVHLFYQTMMGITLHHVRKIILFNVTYEDIPATIIKIVEEYYNNYMYHEIKSITGVKEEIWVNNRLI